MNSGFLLIDKPIDWTSHDVVGYIRTMIRKATGQKKIRVGHAGTLDPFATGLLIVGVGREATKRIDEFKNLPKTYEATIRLGAISDTYDKTGNVEERGMGNVERVTKKQIQDVLQTFLGKQMQIPPMYSAKKVGGKKLYELARKGIEIKRLPNEIEIYTITLLKTSLPFLRGGQGGFLGLRITCSPGTYIRTLAHDIGKKLGTGAYCEELRRTKIGDYNVSKAKGPKDITTNNWQNHLFDI